MSIGGRWTDQLNNSGSIAGYYPLAEEIPTATVVTLMADSGLKYLNTDVYRDK
jgi:hypothetical protein